MTIKKRVAVIGAGICGIVAMRSILEENMEPICFEKTGHYGGLWRYHDDDIDGLASIMKTTVINNSKEAGCLSNKVPPPELPNYFHNKEVYGFLESLVNESNMVPYIRYNKEVTKVEFSEDYPQTGRYDVTIKDIKTGAVEKNTFDGVFVCVGHHVYPNWAIFPGQEKFKGRIIHTHSLKTVDGYEDKNVLVVGIGNSGVDAAVEISNVSKQVYLSTRRGAWIISRLGPKGWPADLCFNRRIVLLLQRILTYDVFCWIFEQIVQIRFDHSLYSLKPKHRILSQHVTVSDTLPVKLLSGAVVVRGNIASFTEDGVIFERETKVTRVDEVIMATGYVIKFPFLGEEITTVTENETNLYKFMYPPHLPHSTLAILGLVQPFGAIFPIAEAQCRLASYALSGRVKLPSRNIMEADITAYKRFSKKRFVSSPRHTIQCDFVSFMDEVNELFGAKPNLFKIFFTDPKLWWALMFGPHLTYQYRMQGPNPWPDARDAILTCKQRVLKPLKGGLKCNNDYKEPTKHKHALLKKIALIAKFFVLLAVSWYVLPYIPDSIANYISENFFW